MSAKPASLEVIDLALVVEAVLVGGDDILVPGHRPVVVVGQELQPLRLVELVQREVLVEDVGLVSVDDFLELVEPQLLFRRPAELTVQLLQTAVRLGGHAVEVAQEVVSVVQGDPQFEALPADRVGVQPQQVESGALGD